MRIQVEVYMRLGEETATEDCNILFMSLEPTLCLDELKVLYRNLRPLACTAVVMDDWDCPSWKS